MSWWSNLVGAFWVLLQILLWLIVIVAVAAVLVAILMGIWQHFRKTKLRASKEWVANLAEAAAISTYRRSSDVGDKVDTYVAGAIFAWEHLNPKK